MPRPHSKCASLRQNSRRENERGRSLAVAAGRIRLLTAEFAQNSRIWALSGFDNLLLSNGFRANSATPSSSGIAGEAAAEMQGNCSGSFGSMFPVTTDQVRGLHPLRLLLAGVSTDDLAV